MAEPKPGKSSSGGGGDAVINTIQAIVQGLLGPAQQRLQNVGQVGRETLGSAPRTTGDDPLGSILRALFPSGEAAPLNTPAPGGPPAFGSPAPMRFDAFGRTQPIAEPRETPIVRGEMPSGPLRRGRPPMTEIERRPQGIPAKPRQVLSPDEAATVRAPFAFDRPYALFPERKPLDRKGQLAAQKMAQRNAGFEPVPPPRSTLLSREEATREGAGQVRRVLTPEEVRTLERSVPTRRNAAGETVPGRTGATYDWTTARKSTLAQAEEARSVSKAGRPDDLLNEYFIRGLFGEHWYEGAFDELQRSLERLAQAAPGNVSRHIARAGDDYRMARNIAATSVATEPGQNVDRAIQAYFQYLAAGRPESMAFPGFKSQTVNLGNIAADRPISGQKVSNYLLDILGSQTHPTIDRWIIELLLPGYKSTQANVEPWMYQVAAERLHDLAQAWNTTPVRAQAALWSGYKMFHDPRIIEMIQTVEDPSVAIPSLATMIRGGFDRAIAKQTWKAQGLGMAALPVIGLAGLLLEDANAAEAAAPENVGPPEVPNPTEPRGTVRVGEVTPAPTPMEFTNTYSQQGSR